MVTIWPKHIPTANLVETPVLSLPCEPVSLRPAHPLTNTSDTLSLPVTVLSDATGPPLNPHCFLCLGKCQKNINPKTSQTQKVRQKPGSQRWQIGDKWERRAAPRKTGVQGQVFWHIFGAIFFTSGELGPGVFVPCSPQKKAGKKNRRMGQNPGSDSAKKENSLRSVVALLPLAQSYGNAGKNLDMHANAHTQKKGLSVSDTA